MHINDHREHICFYLFKASSHALILGHPWLCHHEPHVNWRTGEIRGWGKDCLEDCFNKSTQGENLADINLFSANSATDSEYPDLTSVRPLIPSSPRSFLASPRQWSLPSHRPYDCAIDLIPGSTIPKGCLYSVSGPERDAMKEYMETSLKATLNCPWYSPAGAGFFLVGKKDGSLRPCIDYSPLNDITIKNRYPLPPMSSMFDQLQKAKVFTKLDLHNAYHLFLIREGDDDWTVDWV